MAHYATADEVSDSQLKDLVTEAYLKRADSDLDTLAKRNGVAPEDIEQDPLDQILVDLYVAYLCKRICADNIGINAQAYGNGADVDVYAAKLKHYRAEISRLEGMVTAEILTGSADQPQEFSSSFDIFRG